MRLAEYDSLPEAEPGHALLVRKAKLMDLLARQICHGMQGGPSAWQVVKAEVFFAFPQVVREWLPSRRACLRINIDATRIGNVARFFNHSCAGGSLELCVVRCAGSPLPHVGMFARADIAAGEELTFSYGEATEANVSRAAGRPCHCGAAGCYGLLPADDV
jgi:hypothetical protein